MIFLHKSGFAVLLFVLCTTTSTAFTKLLSVRESPNFQHGTTIRNTLLPLQASPKAIKPSTDRLKSLCITASSTALVHYGVKKMKMDAVAIASTIGFLSASFIPLHATAAFTGAFAGMSGANVVVSINRLLVLSLTTSIFYDIMENSKLLAGVGGRLGTCAACASTLVLLLNGLPPKPIDLRLLANIHVVKRILFHATVICLASMYTSYLQDNCGLNPVLASSSVGLIAFSINNSMAPIAFMGSFIGMGSIQKPLKSHFLVTILQSVICSILNVVFGGTILKGVGGRFGFFAALSILSSNLLIAK